MPTSSRSLPDNVLDHIAAKVGPRLARITDSLGAEQPLVMAESTEVWMLPVGNVIGPSDRLRDLAQPTGRWNHVVRGQTDGTAFAYARTQTDGPDPQDWRVRGVFGAGEISRKMADTIAWIDQNVDDDSQTDYQVRLLEIPGFAMFAFWLVNQSQGDDNVDLVVVIHDPQNIVAERERYLEGDFLNLLRGGPYIVGITL